jgi:energy-coupling factor transporter ATP-binding protein EcfA2
MALIVDVRDLWWRYSPETEWVLKGVNIEVEQGETVAIVGPTGAGKTTLLSFMQALLPHSFPQGEMKGSVYVDGSDVRKITAAKLAGRVGMVFEDAEAQFVFPTVEDDLVFALENLNLSQKDIDERLRKIIEEFALYELIGRTAGELSGGEKQRVSIAGLVAVQPKLLLLDEPTSELDPSSKKEVLAMIRKVSSGSDMTVVIVEQDLEEVATFADRFILIDEGVVQLALRPRDFFLKPEFLITHGVYPPEVCLAFEPLVKAGIVSTLPLSVNEALEAARGKYSS